LSSIEEIKKGTVKQLPPQPSQERVDPWKEFMSKYSTENATAFKKLGVQDTYTLEANGQDLTFKRKRLTTKQYMALEKTRIEFEKKSMLADDPLDVANHVAEMYLIIGQAYLTNVETHQPLQKNEFENMVWEEIKQILDACQLRTAMGVTN
jgi:hypothetical protein